MRTTGEISKNGLEIFEGDSVLWPHAWFSYNGKHHSSYRLVKIVYDQEGHRFILGNLYNLWKGSELTKLSPEDIIKLRKLNVRHGCDVCINSKGKYWVPDPWIKWGLTKEQWDEQNKARREWEYKAIFGDSNRPGE